MPLFLFLFHIFFYNIHTLHTFIQSHSYNTFIRRHSLGSLSISSSLESSVGKTSLWCRAETARHVYNISFLFWQIQVPFTPCHSHDKYHWMRRKINLCFTDSFWESAHLFTGFLQFSLAREKTIFLAAYYACSWSSHILCHRHKSFSLNLNH